MDSKQLNAIIREVIDAMGDEVDMWDVTDKVMAQIPRAELKSGHLPRSPSMARRLHTRCTLKRLAHTREIRINLLVTRPLSRSDALDLVMTASFASRGSWVRVPSAPRF